MSLIVQGLLVCLAGFWVLLSLVVLLALMRAAHRPMVPPEMPDKNPKPSPLEKNASRQTLPAGSLEMGQL